MSTLVASPIFEDFPQFVTGDDINPETVRYLFFPGDVIGNRRRQEMRAVSGVGIGTPDGKPFNVLRNGGYEIGSPCLVRTKGFIPRAYITPLETAAFWIPSELLPTGYPAFSGVAHGNSPMPGQRPAGTLVGEKRFPGDAINWILTSSQNEQGMRLGIVELTALRGANWQDIDSLGLQRLFFPKYPDVSPKLADLEAQIRAVQANDPDARNVQEQMLQACEEFREWGISKIQVEHSLVKMGTLAEGWTYSYSDLARNLMEQLDVTPQDQQFATVARMQEQMAATTQAMMEKAAGADQSEVIAALLKNQTAITEALSAITEKLTTAGNGKTPTPKKLDGNNQ